MVEVLVALVVIGIGMLGIASLYVITLQAKTTSLSRFQAVTLATDIADRIRANRTAATSYDTSATTPANKGCADTTTAATPCSAADMAANDLWQWRNSISATLPGPKTGSGATTGTVSVVAGTPATYTIVITWSEPTSASLSYTLTEQI